MLKLRFANKQHGDVWLVEPAVLLGADASCQVVLKGDVVKPRHAEIQIKGNQLTLVNLAADAGLRVNGAAVGNSVALNAGDRLLVASVELLVVDPKEERKQLQAAAPESSGWALRANHSALANKIYSINGDTVVGRATECDLSFSIAHMSRKHAQLSILNGQLTVKDLDSANGTFVNGKQVNEAKLNRGDELRLDQLSFTVIGPGGDADKTTVRSAVAAPPAAVAAQTKPAVVPQSAQQPSAEQPQVEREKKRAAGTTTFYKALNASELARQNAQSNALPSKTIIILAVVVVAIAVGLAFMFLQ